MTGFRYLRSFQKDGSHIFQKGQVCSRRSTPDLMSAQSIAFHVTLLYVLTEGVENGPSFFSFLLVECQMNHKHLILQTKLFCYFTYPQTKILSYMFFSCQDVCYFTPIFIHICLCLVHLIIQSVFVQSVFVNVYIIILLSTQRLGGRYMIMI